MSVIVATTVTAGLKQGADDAERTLNTLSANVGAGLKQDVGEAVHALSTVSSGIGNALKQDASDVERMLATVSSSGTVEPFAPKVWEKEGGRRLSSIFRIHD